MSGRERWLRVCDAAALLESGDGQRVELPGRQPGDAARAAFVIRYGGQVHAWLNRCAHVPVELDWLPGKFFDDSGLYLVCATHGALYEPDSGRCVGGPCRGARLERVPAREHEGGVWVDPLPPDS